MTAKQTLPIIYEEIKHYFKLDEQGNLYRKVIKSSPLGEVGDWVNCSVRKPHHTGYLYVNFKNKGLSVSRLYFALFHRVDIANDMCIDHIDGNPLNNTKENLRLVTVRENCQNRNTHRDGRLPGTCRTKDGKWQAQINAFGRPFYLGCYEKEEEAFSVYCKGEAMLKNNATREEIQKAFRVAQFTRTLKGVYKNSSISYGMQIRINKKLIFISFPYCTELEAHELFLIADENREEFKGDVGKFKMFVLNKYDEKKGGVKHDPRN